MTVTLTRGLALAASPTLACIALVSGLEESGPALVCGTSHVLSLQAMSTMYLVMCVLHIEPWLKAMRRRRGAAVREPARY